MQTQKQSALEEIICISSEGNTMDDRVDPRFGRCAYFIYVNTATMKFEAVKNPNIEASGGAGIKSAQFVCEKGAKACLTGNVGPNAFKTLQAAGIKVITGISGAVKDAVTQYKKGDFKAADNPSVDSKAGM